MRVSSYIIQLFFVFITFLTLILYKSFSIYLDDYRSGNQYKVIVVFVLFLQQNVCVSQQVLNAVK